MWQYTLKLKLSRHWSADELFTRSSEFVEEGDGHDLIVMECEELLDRPFIFEVASSGYGPASINTILESFLLHTRVLVDFLTKNPKDDDVSASHYFENDEDWKPLRCPKDLDYRRLNKTLTHLTYKRVDCEQQKAWNITQIRQDVEAIWMSFWDKLPRERREWFVSYLAPEDNLY